MRSRRAFLSQVGQGMLIAGIGSGLAIDMGLAGPTLAAGPEKLEFGDLEPLVGLMQETSTEQILSKLVQQLSAGVELKRLVAAGALANARSFGGEDYIGFHTMMAMAPCYRMANELTGSDRALPVLKVLFRNTQRIQACGGRANETLVPVQPIEIAPGSRHGEAVRDAVRAKSLSLAESRFAQPSASARDLFNAALMAVHDNAEVHRTVLPYRAFALLDFVGNDHAITMLRQSVRYCVKSETQWNHSAEVDRPRTLLPQMFDQFRLHDRKPGSKVPDDSWLEHFSQTIYQASPDQAAEAAAMALADGISPDAICEAVTLATNQLVLRDAGRREKEVQPGKQLGSVHGDSIGVHASDSANAWRSMLAASDDRNQFACTILAAYQMAYDRMNRGGDFLSWQPRPLAEHLDRVKSETKSSLLEATKVAICNSDQDMAAACVHRLEKFGDARSVMDLMLQFAISQDGQLHAEKYYHTACEEFGRTRPAYRWRQLTALARVTASCYGTPAQGIDEAKELLAKAV